MNNFQSFLNDYKSNNPKSPFEKSLSKFTNDLKAIISGFKEMIVSNGKQSTPESATAVIRKFEKNREQDFEIERIDFSDIKDILNSIEMNTSQPIEAQKLIAHENRDNYASSDEKEEKREIFEIDMKKKMFEMSKEQLVILRDIRNALKPRVPEELAEQKAKPIDLFAYLNQENQQASSSPMGDMFHKRDNAAVVTDSGKKAPTKPKQSKLGNHGRRR